MLPFGYFRNKPEKYISLNLKRHISIFDGPMKSRVPLKFYGTREPKTCVSFIMLTSVVKLNHILKHNQIYSYYDTQIVDTIHISRPFQVHVHKCNCFFLFCERNYKLIVDLEFQSNIAS